MEHRRGAARTRLYRSRHCGNHGRKHAAQAARSTPVAAGAAMARLAQFGIAIAALGIVLAFMGLYPGVTGITPARGVGLAQLPIILSGFALLIFGALIYVKSTFYVGRTATLAQQIGFRL